MCFCIKSMNPYYAMSRSWANNVGHIVGTTCGKITPAQLCVVVVCLLFDYGQDGFRLYSCMCDGVVIFHSRSVQCQPGCDVHTRLRAHHPSQTDIAT